MKKIVRIARTELETMFYSPVAWLILVVFAFQAAMIFSGRFMDSVMSQDMGYPPYAVTYMTFLNDWGGLFAGMQQYLYLYIPLLTMGLMSRELGSGSIKLLYSSPVTNWQIILGKFLSMMVFGLSMMGVLFIFVLFAGVLVPHFDWSAAFTGMLGLYLLICAYSAVGLFMSSVTSYQVVAAMLTLATLSVLNYVKGWWQDIELVRDITYWLSMSGRADEFIAGLICSEDLIYFIVVPALFLTLAVIRLQSGRQKVSRMATLGKYVGVILAACVVGYLSSRPKLMGFCDATETDMNTLTENSQEVMAKLDGGLTITVFSNVLDEQDWWTAAPERVKDFEKWNFRKYLRFKPDIEMEYVYFYDTIISPEQDERWPELNTEQRAKQMMDMWNIDSTMVLPPEEIRARLDLWPEGNKFIMQLERESGEKTFLRVFNDMQHMPGEAEITAAFKRIAMKLPKVGFLTGHGERDIKKTGDRDYNSFAQEKPFRYSLINQGFDVEEVTLDKEVPEDIRILVVAELRKEMSEAEHAVLDRYIARGGNLYVLSEPNRAEFMAPILEKFGVKLVPGELVRITEDYAPDLIQSTPTKEGGELMYQLAWLTLTKQVMVTPSASGLDCSEVKGYKVTPLFVTDSLVWNELETTDFVDDTARLNPAIGEMQQRYTTAVALSRQMGDREQKVIVMGDADCFSNGELSMSRKGVPANNFLVLTGGFFWLSDNEVPIDVREDNPSDNHINCLTGKSMAVWKVILMWVLPGLMAIFAVVLWFRRRGR